MLRENSSLEVGNLLIVCITASLALVTSQLRLNVEQSLDTGSCSTRDVYHTMLPNDDSARRCLHKPREFDLKLFRRRDSSTELREDSDTNSVSREGRTSYSERSRSGVVVRERSEDSARRCLHKTRDFDLKLVRRRDSRTELRGDSDTKSVSREDRTSYRERARRSNDVRERNDDSARRRLHQTRDFDLDLVRRRDLNTEVRGDSDTNSVSREGRTSYRERTQIVSRRRTEMFENAIEPSKERYRLRSLDNLESEHRRFSVNNNDHRRERAISMRDRNNVPFDNSRTDNERTLSARRRESVRQRRDSSSLQYSRIRNAEERRENKRLEQNLENNEARFVVKESQRRIRQNENAMSLGRTTALSDRSHKELRLEMEPRSLSQRRISYSVDSDRSRRNSVERKSPPTAKSTVYMKRLSVEFDGEIAESFVREQPEAKEVDNNFRNEKVMLSVRSDYRNSLPPKLVRDRLQRRQAGTESNIELETKTENSKMERSDFQRVVENVEEPRRTRASLPERVEERSVRKSQGRVPETSLPRTRDVARFSLRRTSIMGTNSERDESRREAGQLRKNRRTRAESAEERSSLRRTRETGSVSRLLTREETRQPPRRVSVSSNVIRKTVETSHSRERLADKVEDTGHRFPRNTRQSRFDLERRLPEIRVSEGNERSRQVSEEVYSRSIETTGLLQHPQKRDLRDGSHLARAFEYRERQMAHFSESPKNREETVNLRSVNTRTRRDILDEERKDPGQRYNDGLQFRSKESRATHHIREYEARHLGARTYVRENKQRSLENANEGPTGVSRVSIQIRVSRSLPRQTRTDPRLEIITGSEQISRDNRDNRHQNYERDRDIVKVPEQFRFHHPTQGLTRDMIRASDTRRTNKNKENIPNVPSRMTTGQISRNTRQTIDSLSSNSLELTKRKTSLEESEHRNLKRNTGSLENLRIERNRSNNRVRIIFAENTRNKSTLTAKHELNKQPGIVNIGNKKSLSKREIRNGKPTSSGAARRSALPEQQRPPDRVTAENNDNEMVMKILHSIKDIVILSCLVMSITNFMDHKKDDELQPKKLNYGKSNWTEDNPKPAKWSTNILRNIFLSSQKPTAR